jgi:hypothetical protein
MTRLDEEIRRRVNGTIDVDYYRVRATALRGQARRDAFKLKATAKFALIVTAVTFAIALCASAPATFADMRSAHVAIAAID